MFSVEGGYDKVYRPPDVQRAAPTVHPGPIDRVGLPTPSGPVEAFEGVEQSVFRPRDVEVASLAAKNVVERALDKSRWNVVSSLLEFASPKDGLATFTPERLSGPDSSTVGSLLTVIAEPHDPLDRDISNASVVSSADFTESLTVIVGDRTRIDHSTEYRAKRLDIDLESFVTNLSVQGQSNLQKVIANPDDSAANAAFRRDLHRMITAGAVAQQGRDSLQVDTSEDIQLRTMRCAVVVRRPNGGRVVSESRHTVAVAELRIVPLLARNAGLVAELGRALGVDSYKFDKFSKALARCIRTEDLKAALDDATFPKDLPFIFARGGHWSITRAPLAIVDARPRTRVSQSYDARTTAISGVSAFREYLDELQASLPPEGIVNPPAPSPPDLDAIQKAIARFRRLRPPADIGGVPAAVHLTHPATRIGDRPAATSNQEQPKPTTRIGFTRTAVPATEMHFLTPADAAPEDTALVRSKYPTESSSGTTVEREAQSDIAQSDASTTAVGSEPTHTVSTSLQSNTHTQRPRASTVEQERAVQTVDILGIYVATSAVAILISRKYAQNDPEYVGKASQTPAISPASLLVAVGALIEVLSGQATPGASRQHFLAFLREVSEVVSPTTTIDILTSHDTHSVAQDWVPETGRYRRCLIAGASAWSAAVNKWVRESGFRHAEQGADEKLHDLVAAVRVHLAHGRNAPFSWVTSVGPAGRKSR